MTALWRALAGLLGGLLRLRSGPQDMPHSPTLLVLLLVPYAALGSVLALAALPAARALWYGPAETALMAALVYGVLALRGRRGRFVQTLSALALVGGFFNAVSVPLTALAQPGNGIGLLILAVLMWSFAVSVHVLRQALEVPVPAAVLVNLGFFFVAYSTLGHLFGLID